MVIMMKTTLILVEINVSWNRVWIPPTQYSEHNYPEPAINDLLDNLDWNGDYSSYQIVILHL